jgi:hypothetical protein
MEKAYQEGTGLVLQLASRGNELCHVCVSVVELNDFNMVAYNTVSFSATRRSKIFNIK